MKKKGYGHENTVTPILDVFFLMFPYEPGSLAEPWLSSTGFLPIEPCSAYEETGRLKYSAQRGPAWPKGAQPVSRDNSKFSLSVGSQIKIFSVLGD